MHRVGPRTDGVLQPRLHDVTSFEGSVGRGHGRWARVESSGRDVGLAWATTRPFAGDDLACDEELTTPDATRLPSVEGRLQAVLDEWARQAQGLGALDVTGGVGEPEIGVVDTTGQRRGGDTVDAMVKHRM